MQLVDEPTPAEWSISCCAVVWPAIPYTLPAYNNWVGVRKVGESMPDKQAAVYTVLCSLCEVVYVYAYPLDLCKEAVQLCVCIRRNTTMVQHMIQKHSEQVVTSWLQ